VTGSIDDWDSAYLRDVPPPWDIGRPQPVFAELAKKGLLTGAVLDAGCGTGEHALLAAANGASVFGVDASETAIGRAKAKAAARSLDVSFELGDILTMSFPAGSFDTVIDVGLFHVFDDIDRRRYVDVIGTGLRRGGCCYLMCFSDLQPGDWGPRRISAQELKDSFATGWAFTSIEPTHFEINPVMEATTAAAWLAVINRLPTSQ
jgi:SAM-dependent methyltransferase